MTSRFDVFKSLVRSAAKAGAERVRSLDAVAGARRAIDELRNRRVSLGEGMLGSAVAHAPGMRAATVSLREGRVVVDAGYEDGRTLAIAVVPEAARFAPRGAKEVIFRVEPPEVVEDARAREIVGCLAGAIARGLWGPMLGEPREEEAALVDREGARLRADLRSVPAVRAALEGSPLAMALDVLTIRGFEVEDRALRISLGLPTMMAP